MRICYLDAFSGISGDMTVGALADAGADSAVLVRGPRRARDRRYIRVREDATLRHRRDEVPRPGAGPAPSPPSPPLARSGTDRPRRLARAREAERLGGVPEARRSGGGGAPAADRARTLSRGGRGGFDQRHRGRVSGIRAARHRRDPLLGFECRQRNGANGARRSAGSGAGDGRAGGG